VTDDTRRDGDVAGAAVPDGPADPAAAGTRPVKDAPQPATTFEWTPDLASGRLPGNGPASPGEPGPRNPLITAALWIAGLVVLFALASSAAGPAPADGSSFESGRSAGRVVGAVLVWLVVGFVAWGVVVWLERRRGRRRLTSPVVVGIAILASATAIAASGPRAGATSASAGPASPSPPAVGSGATSSPVASAPPAGSAAPASSTDDSAAVTGALTIRSPYTLQRPSLGEEQAVLSQMDVDTSTFKSFSVRRVLKSNSIVAYAFIAETDLKPGADAFVMAALEMAFTSEASSNPAWTKVHSQVNGRDVLTLTSNDGVVSMWSEAPIIKMVVAFDRATVDGVVASYVNR
jgi:hypothetical protein